MQATSPARLLIAFDGSSAGRTAVRASGALFPDGRATVLTVFDEPLSMEQAAAAARVALSDDVIAGAVETLGRHAAEHARATASQGVGLAKEAGIAAQPRTVAAAGSPWAAIREAAEDADVVVCGTRGRGGFSRAVLGSTSSALLHHAGRPVLVVPDGAGELDGPVVLAYDGSDDAREATRLSGRLFPERETVVVHVWQSPIRHTLSGRALKAGPIHEIREIVRDFDELFRGSAQDVADEGAALAREHGVDARAEAFDTGSGVWRGLLAVARDLDAAVVVAGSRGRGAVAGSLLGSTSSGLVHNADLPVLVVPGRATGGTHMPAPY